MDATGQHRSSGALGRRARLGPILVLALAFLALYVLLRQHSFYREDGYQLVHHMLGKGQLWHDVHPLYLPCLAAFRALLAWTGWNVFVVAGLFSATGVAAGILLVGLCARRAGMDRTGVLQAMVLVGLTPAVVRFATVVEFHGFFFAFAALCFLTAEGLVQGEARPPRWGRAVLLGGATALATAAHASGHLLVPLCGLWVLGRRHSADRRRELALTAAVHVAVYVGGIALVVALFGFERHAAGRSIDWLGEWLDLHALGGRLLPQLWGELLWPYLPLWVLFVWHWLGHRLPWRGFRLGAAAIGMYLAAVLLILADRHDGSAIPEHGAYLLPLAIPAALLLARTERVWDKLAWIAFGALILASLLVTHVNNDHGIQPSVLRLQQEELGPDDLVICGGTESVELYTTGQSCGQLLSADTAPWTPGTAAAVVLRFRRELASGHRIYVTELALDELALPSLGPEANALGKALADDFERLPLDNSVATGDPWTVYRLR